MAPGVFAAASAAFNKGMGLLIGPAEQTQE
jgi:hypothetical protein